MSAAAIPYRKAVVLGAGGFIGINLVNALVERGFRVVCFDRVASPHWPREVTSVVGEFVQMPAALLRHLDEAIVFHLVSSCKPSNGTADAQNEVTADLVTTIRYLDATVGRPLRWVFLSSGGTVYGHSLEDRIREDHPTNPICTYGAVKLAIEKYFGIYGTLHGLDHVVARLSNPYGPWQYPGRGQGVVATLLAKAVRDEEIEIWGDGEQVRDFLHVGDATAGLIAAAMSGVKGEVYNVGSGIGHSLNSLISQIEPVVSRKIARRYLPNRTIDVRRNVLDCTKLQARSGWAASDRLNSGGLSSALEWLMRNQLSLNEARRGVA